MQEHSLPNEERNRFQKSVRIVRTPPFGIRTKICYTVNRASILNTLGEFSVVVRSGIKYAIMEMMVMKNETKVSVADLGSAVIVLRSDFIYNIEAKGKGDE